MDVGLTSERLRAIPSLTGELYVLLDGQGERGLDDDLIQVSAGSVVRVGAGFWRTWPARPDSPGQLR